MRSFVKVKLSQNGKVTHLFTDIGNIAIVANFNVANMPYHANHENKILPKISEVTVYCFH